MAKKTDYLNANLTYEDTFSTVINRINEIQYDMGTVVVTTSPVTQPTEANGGQTNGNTHVNGILSANTVSAIDGIRGGTVDTAATLHILSDASFEGANVVITSGTTTYIKDALSVSANASFTGDDLTINITDTLSTTAANNIIIDSPDIDIDSVNIVIGTTGTDILTINSDTSFTANVVIGNASTDQLDVNSNVDFNHNVNVDGTLTTTNNTTLGSSAFDSLDVNATADFNAAVNVDGVFTTTNNVVLGSTDFDTITVHGVTTFNNDVIIGQTEADDLLTVGANTTFQNDVYIGSDSTDTLTVNATATLNNNVTIGSDSTDILSVNSTTDFNSNVGIDGSLTANGDVTLGNSNADTLNVQATTDFDANVGIDGSLTANGDVTLGNADTDTLTVNATAAFNNNVTLGSDNTDSLTVNSAADFNHTLNVDGAVTLNGDVTIGDTTDGADTLTVNANTFFTDDVDIEESLTVDGHTELNSTLNVDGTASFTNSVSIGSSDFDTLTVNASSTFNNNLTVGSDSTDTLTVNATSDFNADVNVDGSFTTTNNVTLGSSSFDTLSVNASADFNSTLNVDGAFTATGNSTLGSDANDTLTVNATTSFKNNVTIGENNGDALTVNSATDFNDNVQIDGTLDVDGNVSLGNNAATDTLTVDAASDFNGTVNVDGSFTTTNNVTLGSSSFDVMIVNATSDFNADVNVDGSFSTTNNVTLGSTNFDTLTVNATSDFNADVNIDGSFTTTNNVTLGSTDFDTLTVNSTSSFKNDVTIGETESDVLSVNANTVINNDMYIGSSSDDTLTVESTTTFKNNVTIGDSTAGADSLTVNANTDFTDDVRISETLNVTGAVSFANTLGVTGASTFANTVSVTGAITGSNTLTIAGTTTLNGNVDLGNAATDTITFTGEVDSNILPSANNTYNLGASTDRWNDLYVQDVYVSANTNSDRYTIVNNDAEIVVKETNLNATTHGTLTFQFESANTNVSNAEVLVISSSSIYPETDNGMTLGTAAKNFASAWIGDSNINSVDIDIIASNTITLDAGTGIALEMDDTNNMFAITANTVTVSNNLTVDGQVILGNAETDTHTINGDTTFIHDVTINKTLNVDSTTALEGSLTVGKSTASTNIIPNTTAYDGQGNLNTGATSIGTSSLKFKDLWVGSINSTTNGVLNFPIASLSNVSDFTDVTESETENINGSDITVYRKDDHNKAYAWNKVSGKFELSSIAALAGEGIQVADLSDADITSLTTNQILIRTSSGNPAVEAWRNLEHELANITDVNVTLKDTIQENIGIGRNALTSAVDNGPNNAQYNAAFGYNALNGLTTGDQNLAVGSGAGSNLTTGSGNIYIGYGAQASSVGVTNELVVGTASLSSMIIGSDLFTANTTNFSINGIVTANSTVVEVKNDRLFQAQNGDFNGNLNVDGDTTLTSNVTIGDIISDVNISDSTKQYKRGGQPLISVQANEPTGVAGNLWWETDTGILKIYYNDGNSSEWVDAIPVPNLTQYFSTSGGTVSGAVTIDSTLNVTGATTLDSTLVVDGDTTINGNLAVAGTFAVSGTFTQLNTETLTVDDNIIVLNNNYAGSSPTESAGVEVERGTLTNTALVWNETTDRWTFTNDGTAYYNIPISTEYDNYGSWTLQGDSGDNQTISSGDTVDITGGTYITTVTSDTDTLTVNHDTTTRTNSTNGNTAPGYGGSFTAIDSITTNTTGHITAVNTKTITIPASDNTDTNTTYEISSVANTAANAGLVKLLGDDDSNTYVTIIGSGATTVQSNTTAVYVSSVNTTYTGGTYISLDGTTFNHDATTRTNTTTGNTSPGYGGTFTAIDSITTNTTGHITAVNTKTITIPASDNTDTNTTYDLVSVANTVNGVIRLSDSANVNDDIGIFGSNATSVTSNSSGIYISSTDTNDNDNTTYDISSVTTTGGALLRLTAGGSGSGTDDVKFASGTNVTVAYTDASTITISSTDTNTDTLQSIAADATNANQYITFVANNSGAQTGRVDAGLMYNPSTNTLDVANITDCNLLETDGSNPMYFKNDQGYYNFQATTASSGSKPQYLQLINTDTATSDDQAIGGINFQAKNSASVDKNYVQLIANTKDVTSATEDGWFKIDVLNNASAFAVFDARGSGDTTITSAVDLLLIPTSQNVYMRGTTSTEQLWFNLGTTKQSIKSSDEFEIASTGGNIRLDANSGIIDLYHSGTQDIRLDVATTDTLKLYTGTATLNTTFSGSDMTVEGDVTSLSDVRTKENIATIENALDTVTSLRGVTYNKIGDDARKVGVIAQEVEEVLPEVVKTNEEGMKSVDYGKMVGVLIEAMKEQQEQIAALQSEIEALKANK